MGEYNWAAYQDPAYDDLADEAARDNRVGKQLFMVTNVQDDKWPKSGDAFKRVSGVLTTAGNAKCEMTFSQPISPEEMKAERANWDQRKIKAIANSRAMVQSLIEHYGVNPGQIKQGDVFGVNVVKNKEGFVRIVAIVPLDAVKADKEADTGAGEAAPF